MNLFLGLIHERMYRSTITCIPAYTCRCALNKGFEIAWCLSAVMHGWPSVSWTVHWACPRPHYRCMYVEGVKQACDISHRDKAMQGNYTWRQSFLSEGKSCLRWDSNPQHPAYCAGIYQLSHRGSADGQAEFLKLKQDNTPCKVTQRWIQSHKRGYCT